MLKYLIIILSLSLLVQCNVGNKPKENVKGTLIGQSLVGMEEKEKEYQIEFEFEEVVSYIVDYKEGQLVIYLDKIKDWSDPGDYHRIRIVREDKEESFFNMEGWVMISNYERSNNNLTDLSNELNSQYIYIHRACDGNLLLFSFGYVYASMPGLLSVFNITQNNSTSLVFNENKYIYSFNKKEPFDFTVTSCEQQSLDNKCSKSYRYKNGWFFDYLK